MLIHADSFPKFNPVLAVPVLKLVRDNISGIGIIDKLPPLNIGKNFYSDYPIYFKAMDGSAWILINDDGNDEFQWLYQFAHEYMHYYINACNPGKPMVCHWFEETLCCLSTLTRLFEYGQAYPKSKWISKDSTEVSPQDILNSHRLQAQTLLPDALFRIFGVGMCLHHLPMAHSSARDFYDLCNAIAVRIMPLFVQNRNLWRIVGHLRSSEYGRYSFSSYMDELIWMSAKEHIYCLSELNELKKILLPLP